MSRLSDPDEIYGEASLQRVLPFIAASDAGGKKKKRRKTKVKTDRPLDLVRHGTWKLLLFFSTGERMESFIKGDYKMALTVRDEQMKSGRFEKSWLISL